MKNFNAKIINEIFKQTPDVKNQVNYLMDILSISKETSYRRFKNKIPFSINEVAVIAERFNLSVDRLLDLKSGTNFPFNKTLNIHRNPEEIYADFLRGDIELMESLAASTEMKITATMNKIPFRFLPFQELFKFEYCHYLYSTGKISLMSARFSDLEIPSLINELHNKTVSCFNSLKNLTCIVDSALYANIIKKIQYYHRLKFLSDEDIQILQAELFELLGMYENLLRSGKNKAGFDHVFYYSFFNIESNIVYIEYDANTLLQIWVYPESPVIIKDNQMISDIQRRWIDSKMRTSMLISKTADIQQVEMLREIYKQISDIGNYDF